MPKKMSCRSGKTHAASRFLHWGDYTMERGRLSMGHMAQKKWEGTGVFLLVPTGKNPGEESKPLLWRFLKKTCIFYDICYDRNEIFSTERREAMKLYIDPGTGSMLFTILIGLVGAVFYSLRMILIKLRFHFSGGKEEKNQKRIPFVIFSDNKRYWVNFAPICRELDRRGQDVVYMTASPDDPVLENPYPHIHGEFIGDGNKAFAKLNFLNAAIVLSTTPGLDVYQWKRSKDVAYYVHIPHAPNDITLYRMFGLDYYDAVLLSGEYQVNQLRQLEALRGLPAKDMEIVGVPYMDEMAGRLRNAPALPSHEKTVLLAPSWGKSAIFGVYGREILDVLLKTDYHIIVRPHPQSYTSEKEMIERLMEAYSDSQRLEWNRDNDNFEVLRRSDILISDFSGVIFEFSLIYDKPVIYTDPQFDLSPYDAWWLKEPLWTTSVLPKIGSLLTRENMEDLGQQMDACLTDPRYALGRQEVKAQTWGHPGEGAVRAAEYLLNKYKELEDKEVK